MTWWRSKGPAGGPPRRWRRWLWTLLLLPGLGLAQLPVAEPEVRVIVDVSGSMRGNDPEQLAASAVELLAALLPDGVRAGVWTFGTEVATPLPLAGVDDAWRRRAMALRPDLVEYQQYTDIEAAVAAAAEPPAEGERHLVLLTDGVIDLPPARGDKPAIDGASRRRLLESLAPTSPGRGWWPTPSPSPPMPTWRWWRSWAASPGACRCRSTLRKACRSPSWTSSNGSSPRTRCRWTRAAS